MSEDLGARRKRRSKKLLVAAIGVASVSYLGCPGITLGNLVEPPPCTGPNEPDGCWPPQDSGVAADSDGGPDGGVDGGTGDASSGDR